MMYRLIVLTGPLTGQRINVEKEPMTLGRDANVSLVLPDEEVARQHAIIEHTSTGLNIRDLGSMNRILVNKREVHESKLKHGDIFEVGRTRFLVQACVQAEVNGLKAGRAMRKTRFLAAAAVIVIIFSAASWYALQPRKTVQPAPSPAPKSIPVAPAVSEAPSPAVKSAAAPAPSAESVAGDASARGAPAEPVPTEIREMREQLDEIRSTVKDLASKDRVTSATSMSYPVIDPLRQRTQRMLDEARVAAESGRVADSDQILSNIQMLDPDLLESYVQRAALFEKRGMLKKSIDQWTEVMKRSMGTPLYDRAKNERSRVTRIEVTQAGVGGRLLQIASVEPQRFPQSDEFDELRAIEISLRPESPAQPLDTDAVRVDVQFYDEDPVTGEVTPSRFSTSKGSLRVEGAWAPDEEKRVAATYAVPKGFREGRQEHYYGFVVNIFYHDVLQDSEARPRSLLPPAETNQASPAAGSTNYVPVSAIGTTS